jgi:hypothetical protein
MCVGSCELAPGKRPAKETSEIGGCSPCQRDPVQGLLPRAHRIRSTLLPHLVRRHGLDPLAVRRPQLELYIPRAHNGMVRRGQRQRGAVIISAGRAPLSYTRYGRHSLGSGRAVPAPRRTVPSPVASARVILRGWKLIIRLGRHRRQGGCKHCRPRSCLRARPAGGSTTRTSATACLTGSAGIVQAAEVPGLGDGLARGWSSQRRGG